MKKILTIAMALMFSSALLSVTVWGQTTYTWNQTAAAAYGTAANWTPTRTTPATNDVLVIDGSVTPATTITGLVTQTIGQLKVTNNAYVTLTAAAAAVITISGGTGTDFQIDAGSKLLDSADVAITISVATGATGSISGTYVMKGVTVATAHRLLAADASSITFNSGSICGVDTLFSGNLAGTTGTANIIIFASGSVYYHVSGSNPFGLGQPASRVTFQTGSLFRLAGNVTPAFSGRTYADFEMKASGTSSSPTGSAACSIDNLTVTAGRLNIGMTGTFTIKKNITVGVGDTLIFKPAGAGSVTLNGTSAQTFTNSGILIIDTTQNFVLNNSNNFTLIGDAALHGTLTFTAGKLSVTTGTLTLGPTAAVSGIGSGKIIDGKIARKISAIGKLFRPLGQGTDYLPDTLFVGAVTTPGTITAQILDKTVTPFSGTVSGATQTLKRYSRTTLDPNLNISLDSVAASYATADLPAGVFASNLQVVRWNGGPWLILTTRIDSVANVLYTKGNFGPGDYVITGPAGFLVSSKTSINYGTVLSGQSKTDSVNITNSGNKSLSVDSVKSTLGDFTVNPTSLSIPAGGTSKFYIAYAPVTAGTKTAKVVFYHGGINGRDTVAVDGGASLITNFAATPDSLDFGTQIRNSSKTDTIVVANSGNVALKVDSVKSPDPSFKISPASANIGANGTGKFFITYKPASAGAKSAKLVFYSNSSTQPDTVYVKGDVVIAPLFSATKTTVDFGALNLGKNKIDSVTVTNAGTSTMTISSVVSSDAVYVITPTTATLAVDAAQKFYITFSPTVAGTRKATIILTSNVTEVRDTLKITGFGSVLSSIAEARKDVNNDLIADHSITKDTLVITGVVTSPNMGASAGRASYFIQDATGGIEVDKFGTSPAAYQRGDSVIAVGIVNQFNGLVEFAPLVLDTLNFQILKHNATIPKPKRLTLHQFVTNAESYEGQLIELDTLYKATGTWPAVGVGNVSVFVTNATHADTAQMFLDLDAAIGGSKEPAYPINVVGVVSQFTTSVPPNNGYEISPRDSLDIIHTPGITGVQNQFSGIPNTFELLNNYPNPFNPSTTILYGLPQQSHVTVTIYSVLGQELATLVNEVQAPSYYRVVWNGQDKNGGQVSSGVYFFRLVAQSTDGKAQSFMQVKKMLMMK